MITSSHSGRSGSIAALFMLAVVVMPIGQGAEAQGIGADVPGPLSDQAANGGSSDQSSSWSDQAKTWQQITKSCQKETARFCPDLPPGSSARDQAICLKFYRTSLSLSCRGAVTAAIQ